jgi:hypothetical protein
MSEVLVVETTTTETKGITKPTERPDPAWVRGKCPCCGDAVVSNLYYVGGKGYLLRWECWSSLGDTPTCEYRKVL